MGRIIYFLILLAFPSLLWAQDCQYQFNQNQINVNYNGATLTTYFTLNIDRPNSANPSPICDRFAFFFGMGNANSYQRKVFKNGQTIGYTLEKINPTGTLKAFGDHSSENEFLSDTIALGQSKVITGLFKMPQQNMPGGAGHYQDVVNVTVFGYQSASSYKQGMTKQLVINVQTTTSIDLSIVPQGGAYDSSSTSSILNFGELELNDEMGADLIVKSNTGYRVRVSSANGGNFKHANQLVYIPYTFNFAGSAIGMTLSALFPVTVVNNTTGSAAAGDRYNMRVKIGSVAGKATGEYSDVITVTVIAQ